VRGHAISSSGFPSDTNLLVDACIARVREAARLDDDAVLPPLPRVAPRRDVVILRKDQTAGSAAGSAACSTPEDATAGDERGGGRSDVTQLVSRRGGSAARRSRWALGFCALLAGAFGTAAFLESPAGQAPSVVRATSAARKQMDAAASATAALFTR
jgi:hypothetical protein